ncbi:MAG: hypothetical protein WC889_13745 [Myxococcota bacterium]|jgi:hypothetical protein
MNVLKAGPAILCVVLFLSACGSPLVPGGQDAAVPVDASGLYDSAVALDASWIPDAADIPDTSDLPDTSELPDVMDGGMDGASLPDAEDPADSSGLPDVSDAGPDAGLEPFDAGEDSGAGSDAGCQAETDQELCSRYLRQCGSLAGTDNCGDDRLVADCGACSAHANSYCSDGACACRPDGCEATGRCDGSYDNGCGAAMECGGCTGCKDMCSSGFCAVTPHAIHSCYSGSVYWYDSCGNREGEKEHCDPGNQLCAGGACTHCGAKNELCCAGEPCGSITLECSAGRCVEACGNSCTGDGQCVGWCGNDLFFCNAAGGCELAQCKTDNDCSNTGVCTSGVGECGAVEDHRCKCLPKPGSIIPGRGIDLWTSDTVKKSIVVLSDTYGTVTSALGAGTLPDPGLNWYRRWATWATDALFVNTMRGAAISDGDRLNQLNLTSGFPGATAGGNGVGSTRTEWLSEMPAPEYSPVTVKDGKTYITDYYYARLQSPERPGGLAVLYEDGTSIQVSVFREQLKAPLYDLDWENSRIWDIVAGLTNGSPWSTVTSELGPADLTLVDQVSGVDIENRVYVQQGLTFTGGNAAEGPVINTTVTAPYLGKLKHSADARIGSLHDDVRSFFLTQNLCCNTATLCAPPRVQCTEGMKTITDSKTGRSVNIYYYRVRYRYLMMMGNYYETVGLIYDETPGSATQNRLVSILMGFLVEAI